VGLYCIDYTVWLHHICMVVKMIILLFFFEQKKNDNTLVRCPFRRTCPSAATKPNSQRRACSIYALSSISTRNPQLLTRFARRDSLRSPHAPATSAARCPHPVLHRVVPRPRPYVSCPPLSTVHRALSLAASRCCRHRRSPGQWRPMLQVYISSVSDVSSEYCMCFIWMLQK
jgi:hypothetical protein